MKLFKNSIRKQLFIQVFSIIAVCVLIILALNSRLLGKVYIANEKANLVKFVTLVNEIDFDSDDFYSQIAEIENEYNINTVITDSNGSAVYFTGLSEIKSGLDGFSIEDFDLKRFLSPHSWEQREDDAVPEEESSKPQGESTQEPSVQKPMEPAQTQAQTGGFIDDLIIRIYGFSQQEDGVFAQRQERNENSRFLLYITDLTNGYNIEVSTKQTVIENNATIANKVVIVIAVFVCLLAMVIVLFYSKRFTKPLVEMNDITRGMANMDFSKKCTAKRTDEIGQLGSSINLLSDSLALTLNDLKEKNIQLEKDIEFERKQEKVRKEFISNVSHELKTPIAIIQGYAEGLQSGVADDKQSIDEYCQVINEEAQKMNKMVLSLLELSKYEFGAYELKCESFNVKDFITAYTDNMALIFEEKGVDFTLVVGDGCTAWGDVDKLNMVLNNFVSNALSHIEGEKRLVISCDDLGESYRIKVFNSGKNIDGEDMENIWISFYRADKSHSRSQGRYGIGLSIAKAIQNLHSQGFGCENNEDGVTFWFDVKKDDSQG